MKVESTFIVSFSLTTLRESKMLKGGVTLQHVAPWPDAKSWTHLSAVLLYAATCAT
jgi:uncharacterized membrane protein